MVDIVPQLLEKLKKDFESGVGHNAEIQRLKKLIREKKGTYIDAEEIAKEIGAELSKTFGDNLSSAVLPDGKMYYNIADRTVRPLLEESYTMATHEAMEVQKQLNEKAHIGLGVKKPSIDTDRVEGIINSLSNAEQFDDIVWLLGDPLIGFALQAVTDVVRENFEFQGKAGLKPKLIRTSEHKCCEWCRSLAGTYSYPVENRDVFRRHQRCRCSVIYDQGDGFRENVHTRQQITSEERAKREARKTIGTRSGNKTVTGYSDQVVEYLQNRTVTPEALRDALNNPLNVHLKADALTTEIIGKKCTITLDKKGKILTVYPTHTATAKQYKR